MESQPNFTKNSFTTHIFCLVPLSGDKGPPSGSEARDTAYPVFSSSWEAQIFMKPQMGPGLSFK